MWRAIRRLMASTLTPQETAALARDLLTRQIDRELGGIVTSQES